MPAEFRPGSTESRPIWLGQPSPALLLLLKNDFGAGESRESRNSEISKIQSDISGKIMDFWIIMKKIPNAHIFPPMLEEQQQPKIRGNISKVLPKI